MFWVSPYNNKFAHKIFFLLTIELCLFLDSIAEKQTEEHVEEKPQKSVESSPLELEIQEKKKKIGLLKRIGAKKTPLADLDEPVIPVLTKPVPKPRSPIRVLTKEKEEETKKEEKRETKKEEKKETKKEEKKETQPIQVKEKSDWDKEEEDETSEEEEEETETDDEEKYKKKKEEKERKKSNETKVVEREHNKKVVEKKKEKRKEEVEEEEEETEEETSEEETDESESEEEEEEESEVEGEEEAEEDSKTETETKKKKKEGTQREDSAATTTGETSQDSEGVVVRKMSPVTRHASAASLDVVIITVTEFRVAKGARLDSHRCTQGGGGYDVGPPGAN